MVERKPFVVADGRRLGQLRRARETNGKGSAPPLLPKVVEGANSVVAVGYLCRRTSFGVVLEEECRTCFGRGYKWGVMKAKSLSVAFSSWEDGGSALVVSIDEFGFWWEAYRRFFYFQKGGEAVVKGRFSTRPGYVGVVGFWDAWRGLADGVNVPAG